MKPFHFVAPTSQGPACRQEQVFLIAMQFHDAALRSSTEEIDPNGGRLIALCPMIVSYAFAAELYLKSLISFEMREHELDVLYRRLSDEQQSVISNFYKQRTGRDASILKKDIKLLAKSFLKWRYVFERDGQQVHLNLLIALVKSLLQASRSLHPDWSVRDYLERKLLSDANCDGIAVMNLGGGAFVHMVDPTGSINKRDRGNE